MISYEIRTLASQPRQSHDLFWDVSENPYFKFADRVIFGAFQGAQCVGSVVGVWDERAQPKEVYFAQLDCSDDVVMARALLDAVSLWGAQRGATKVSGPLVGAGPFVWGDSLSSELLSQLTSMGYVRGEKRIAFEYDLSRSVLPDPMQAQAERLRFSGKVKIRSLDAETLFQLLGERSGCLSLRELEEVRWCFRTYAKQLDERALLCVEVLGQPAGFALAMRENSRSSVWQMGQVNVLARFRHWGLGCLLLSELDRALVKLGAHRVKTLGQLEGASGFKRYRAMRPQSERVCFQIHRDF